MCGKKSQPDFRSAPVHGCMPQNRFTGRQGVDDYRTNQGGSLAKMPAHVYNGGSGHVPHASRDNLQPLATATQNSFVTAKQQLVGYFFSSRYRIRSKSRQREHMLPRCRKGIQVTDWASIVRFPLHLRLHPHLVRHTPLRPRPVHLLI